METVFTLIKKKKSLILTVYHCINIANLKVRTDIGVISSSTIPDTKRQTHFSAQCPKVQPVFLSSRLDRPYTQLSATLFRSQSVRTAAAARQEHFPPVLVIPALVPSYFWS